ncbi:hypothetical protein ACKGLS_004737 [Vibrio alginolyticus]
MPFGFWYGSSCNKPQDATLLINRNTVLWLQRCAVNGRGYRANCQVHSFTNIAIALSSLFGICWQASNGIGLQYFKHRLVKSQCVTQLSKLHSSSVDGVCQPSAHQVQWLTAKRRGVFCFTNLSEPLCALQLTDAEWAINKALKTDSQTRAELASLKHGTRSLTA